jgi:hypothetical protein
MVDCSARPAVRFRNDFQFSGDESRCGPDAAGLDVFFGAGRGFGCGDPVRPCMAGVRSPDDAAKDAAEIAMPETAISNAGTMEDNFMGRIPSEGLRRPALACSLENTERPFIVREFAPRGQVASQLLENIWRKHSGITCLSAAFADSLAPTTADARRSGEYSVVDDAETMARLAPFQPTARRDAPVWTSAM